MSFIKNKLRGASYKWQFFKSVNWFKTFYFNLKKFPFNIAKKLPVLIYGKVKLSNISGNVKIEGPINSGMITFGRNFELRSTHKGIAQLHIEGSLVFKGYTHIGKDFFFYVAKNAFCEFGNMSALGSDVKLVCTDKIVIGNWTGIGYESQVIDSNSHPMINTLTGEHYKISSSIKLGDYNAISNRVSIMSGTITSNNIVVASNSLLNRDYTKYGEEVLLGGVTAKLIKENFARDWQAEKDTLISNKVVKFNWIFS